MRMRLAILAAALLSLVAASAFAQQPTRIRGVVEKVDGATLTVNAGAAGEEKVVLAGDVQVYGLVKVTLADIKPNTFVGVGAMPQADGSQKAIRVQIFPEQMRGLGEGSRPWDRPGTTMTNGAVDKQVTDVSGQVLTVKYKGGEQKIVVTPETTIHAYVIGDRSELKPGAHIATVAARQPDGSLQTSRITVGRDGLTP